jgi:hypothetical protein
MLPERNSLDTLLGGGLQNIGDARAKSRIEFRVIID